MGKSNLHWETIFFQREFIAALQPRLLLTLLSVYFLGDFHGGYPFAGGGGGVKFAVSRYPQALQP